METIRCIRISNRHDDSEAVIFTADLDPPATDWCAIGEIVESETLMDNCLDGGFPLEYTLRRSVL